MFLRSCKSRMWLSRMGWKWTVLRKSQVSRTDDMVAATVINPNLKNCKLSYRKGSRHPGLWMHSLWGAFGYVVLSSKCVPGAAEGAHTPQGRHTSQVCDTSKHKHLCHPVHFVARGKHIFPGNARLERIRLGANMPGGGMERRGWGKPSPGENTYRQRGITYTCSAISKPS